MPLLVLVSGFSNPTVAPDERNSMGPRPAFQDRIDGGQVHPSSEVGHPAFATVTDDLHYTDGRASECHVVCPGVDADICSFLHQLKILAIPEGGKLIL